MPVKTTKVSKDLSAAIKALLNLSQGYDLIPVKAGDEPIVAFTRQGLEDWIFANVKAKKSVEYTDVTIKKKPLDKLFSKE